MNRLWPVYAILAIWLALNVGMLVAGWMEWLDV